MSEHRLNLAIVRIKADVTPTASPPFWQPGGDHFMLGLAVESDREIAFAVVLPTTGSDFATLHMLPGARESGARLIAELARAFELEPPAPTEVHALAPARVSFIWLGRRGRRSHTKWCLGPNGAEEVYFNFDLDRRAAELLEKDPDYSPAAIVELARIVRDGSPSLDGDPRMAPGPTFANERALGTGRLQLQRLFADRAVFLAMAGSTGDRLVSYDFATATETELARFPAITRARWCEARGGTWLLEVRDQSGAAMWWVGDGEPRELARPDVDDWHAAEVPLSPDGRFVAAMCWAPSQDTPTRFSTLWFCELATGAVTRVSDGELCFIAVGWHEHDGVMVAQGERSTGFGSRDKAWAVDIDPATGAVLLAQRVARRDARGRELVSPDGARAASLDEHGLSIIDRGSATARRFPMRADELVGAELHQFKWVSPRYLLWRHREGALLIDAEQLRMSAPLRDSAERSLYFAPDFQHVVMAHAGAWSVADIVGASYSAG